MSLDIRRTDSSGQTSFSAGDDQPKAQNDAQARSPHDFDFAGHAYAAVHLPTGLIPTSSTSMPATVRADVADLKSKVATLMHDLKSPEVVNYANGAADVYAAYVKVNLCAGKVAVALYAMEKGDVKEGLTALKEGFGFPSALRALGEAHREFMKVNGPKTNAAFARVAHDLAEVDKSEAKLMADVAKVVTP